MMTNAFPFVRLVQFCLLALFAVPLAAHSTPNTEVRLHTSGDAILADITLPRGEYAYGTGNPIDGGTRSLAVAQEYLRERIRVSTPDGRDWSIRFQTVEFVQRTGPPDLHAVIELTPPTGGSRREFTIDWQVLTDRLPGHFALFILGGASQTGDGTIIGAVRRGSPPLQVEVIRPSAIDLLGGSMAIGAHHIVEGYDHMLFLLALLLPAPLIARSGRWGATDTPRRTVVKLVKIVTAFTAGHSLTLVTATLGRWALPVAPVEVAIAISVLISAMHASRPILPGKEPLVALIFGLVHGLAFATLVQDAQTEMAGGMLTLFGFNLGIELVQLVIVGTVVPPLLVFARYPFYSNVRQTMAFICAAAATAWLVNRTTGLAEGAVDEMEFALGQMIWLAVATSLLAVSLALWRALQMKHRGRCFRTASA